MPLVGGRRVQCRSDSGRSRFPVLLDDSPRDPAVGAAHAESEIWCGSLGDMPIQMASVRPEHAADLAGLKAATFIETFAAENDPEHVQAHVAREFTAEAVRRTLEDERCSTWWLLDDDAPIGFLKVNRGGAQTEPHLGDGLEIEQIYVLASHHGQRLGGRLLEHAIATAVRRHVR